MSLSGKPASNLVVMINFLFGNPFMNPRSVSWILCILTDLASGSSSSPSKIIRIFVFSFLDECKVILSRSFSRELSLHVVSNANLRGTNIGMHANESV